MEQRYRFFKNEQKMNDDLLILILKIIYLQEPFVNIPDETIRESLKILLGINITHNFIEKNLNFHGSKIFFLPTDCCRCKESPNSDPLQKRQGKKK